MEVQRLAILGVHLCDTNNGVLMVLNVLVSSYIAEVKEKQCDDPILSQVMDVVYQQMMELFS